MYAEAPAGPEAFAFTPRQLLDVASPPGQLPPGTQYRYSNTNTALLGQAVEKITGMPLGDYFAAQRRTSGPGSDEYPATGVMPEPFTHGYAPTPDGDIVDATF